MNNDNIGNNDKFNHSADKSSVDAKKLNKQNSKTDDKKVNNSNQKSPRARQGINSNVKELANSRENANPDTYDELEKSAKDLKNTGKKVRSGIQDLKSAKNNAANKAASTASKANGKTNGFNQKFNGAKKKASKVTKVAGKVVKKTTGTVIILTILLLIFSLLLPVLLLEAFVIEAARFIIAGVYQIRSEFFGYDDFCDLPKEEQERIVDDATKEFFGDVGRASSGVTKALYTVFARIDDWTDDSTFIGAIADNLSDFFFGATVSIDDAVNRITDPNYDSMTAMPLLVMQRIQYYTRETTDFIQLDQLQEQEKNAQEEIFAKYSTAANPEVNNETVSTDPKNMIEYITRNDATATIPACNVPIVIEGKDNWVTLDGELIGTIDEEKGTQTLDDCIIYNPYGNTRSNMTMTIGNNYALYSQACYVIAMYNASCPYSDQTMADLLTRLDDGMRQYFNENDECVHYNYDISEVYRGALVPRFYQPLLYKNTTDGTYTTGHYVMGSYRSSVSSAIGNLGPDTRGILGMTPLTEEEMTGYVEEQAMGWFDLNGDGIYQKGQEDFPIVMQTLGTDVGGKQITPDSYVVLSTDPRRCNINFDYNMSSKSLNDILNGDESGFYIYGTEAGKQEYATINWHEDFQNQMAAQETAYAKLTPEAQKDFAFRYQMPFTRTSYSDSYYHSTQFVRVRLEDYNHPQMPTNYGDYDIDELSIMRISECDETYSEDSVYQFNGGVLNGYYAWAYIPEDRQDEYVFNQPNLEEKALDPNDRLLGVYNPMGWDNWSKYEGYELTKEDGYETKNWLYHVKVRYFISVDIVAQLDFLDAVAEVIKYKPEYPTPGYTSDMYVGEPEDMNLDYSKVEDTQTKLGFRETQGENAMAIYQNYLDLLGVDPGEIIEANPVLGTEPQYSYQEMLSIVRNLTNADGTPATMNQKYLAYIAISAAGHMTYDFGNELEPGLNFVDWIQDAPDDPSSSTPDIPDRIGTDCTGFVYWAYITAFGQDMFSSRFSTQSAINLNESAHVGTKSIRNGNTKGSSNLGTVFTNKDELKVGDMSIYVKWEATPHSDGTVTWTRKGHAMIYLGINKDDPTKQLWIEMTRWKNNSKEVNGIRLVSYEDYGESKDAVFIRLSDKIPQEDVPWTEISPAYMMVPKKGEV